MAVGPPLSGPPACGSWSTIIRATSVWQLVHHYPGHQCVAVFTPLSGPLACGSLSTIIRATVCGSLSTIIRATSVWQLVHHYPGHQSTIIRATSPPLSGPPACGIDDKLLVHHYPGHQCVGVCTPLSGPLVCGSWSTIIRATSVRTCGSWSTIILATSLWQLVDHYPGHQRVAVCPPLSGPPACGSLSTIIRATSPPLSGPPVHHYPGHQRVVSMTNYWSLINKALNSFLLTMYT